MLMVFPSLAMFGSGVWWVFSKVLQKLGLNLSFPFCSYYSPKRAKSPLPDVISGFDLGQHEGRGTGFTRLNQKCFEGKFLPQFRHT